MRPEAELDQRRTIIAAARELYELDGFAATDRTAILERAGLDSAAFRGQFQSADELFYEVYREVQQELAAEVHVRACSSQDPVTRLRLACAAVLDAAADPCLAQIVYVDGPRTLGAARCRELARFAAVLRESVQDVVELRSETTERDVALAEVVVRGLHLAADKIAHSGDPCVRTDVGSTIDAWLDQLVAVIEREPGT